MYSYGNNEELESGRYNFDTSTLIVLHNHPRYNIVRRNSWKKYVDFIIFVNNKELFLSMRFKGGPKRNMEER
jgi:hypothetical protein